MDRDQTPDQRNYLAMFGTYVVTDDPRTFTLTPRGATDPRLIGTEMCYGTSPSTARWRSSTHRRLMSTGSMSRRMSRGGERTRPSTRTPPEQLADPGSADPWSPRNADRQLGRADSSPRPERRSTAPPAAQTGSLAGWCENISGTRSLSIVCCSHRRLQGPPFFGVSNGGLRL
jgi:hypothetical protein